jgi:hypothetical protein
MKTILAFARFMLARKLSARVTAWRKLRALCLERIGKSAKRKKAKDEYPT